MARAALVSCLLVSSLFAAVLVAEGGGRRADAAQPSPRAPAAVRVSECRPAEAGGGAASERATFQGRMRSVPGTDRMSMRFRLLERRGDGRYARVEVPGLGVWRRSRSGVRRFVYSQQIRNLHPAASYRVRVDYRWLDRGGEAIRSARRRSRPCGPAGAPPNLRVLRVRPREGASAGRAVYSIVVENSGGTVARDVRVGVTIDGRRLVATTVPALRPLERRRVELTGSVCSRTVSAVVDPDDRVAESLEDDNVRGAPCPAA